MQKKKLSIKDIPKLPSNIISSMSHLTNEIDLEKKKKKETKRQVYPLINLILAFIPLIL